jgi:hypothetical protein
VRVCIRNGDCDVDLEADGSYAPDVMVDLVNRAVDTYRRAFVDEADEDDEA